MYGLPKSVCVVPVTAPSLVGCVVWSLYISGLIVTSI